MDEVVIRKLESLGRCIRRIESKLPESPDDFAENIDAQDIVALNLERAIQMCVDVAAHLLSLGDNPLPETMAKLFDAQAKAGTLDPALAQSLRKAVGLRNLAVHDYSALDWKQLHAYLPKALDDLRAYSRAIASMHD